MDIASLPSKNYTFSGRESEPTVARRPFSPISSVASSRANADFNDDQNILQNNSVQKSLTKNETPQKIVSLSNTSFTTPSKKMPAADEENHTPNTMLIQAPITPLTVSAPMQTSMTPAPLKLLNGDNMVEDIAEDIEYSFEERRAGFVLPNTPLRRAIHV